MKVILREDIEDVGQAGQVIEVKNGFGRNYLLPRNLAIPASEGNLKSIGEIQKQKDIRSKKRRRAADIVKDRIEKLSLQIEVQVGEEDRMFGSVTNSDIAALLQTNGVTVDKRAVEIEEPIKALGVYTVPVKIDKEVTANVRVWVVKKS
ncbi:MAG: 50S ribosomal protein L9 [Candidatus Zixiibacteriota bacterium]